jgi:flagellar hook-length control protein FliK
MLEETADASEDFLAMLQTTAASLRSAPAPEMDPLVTDLPASHSSPTSFGGEDIDVPADMSDAPTTVSQDPLVLAQLSLWLGAQQAGMPAALETGCAEAGQPQNQPLISTMITPSQAPQPSRFGPFPALNGAEGATDTPQPAGIPAPTANPPHLPTSSPSPVATSDVPVVTDMRMQPDAAVTSQTMHASSSPPITPMPTSATASPAVGPVAHAEATEQLASPSSISRRAEGQSSSPSPTDSGQSPSTAVTEPSELYSGTEQGLVDDGHQDANGDAAPDLVQTERSRKPEPVAFPAGAGEVTPQALTAEAAAPEPVLSTLTHQAIPDAEPVPIVTQIFDHMHVAIREGRHELRLALTPENLGTVQVEIVTDHQEITAQLLVESPLIKEMLEENLYKLKDALQAQGLQINELNVSVGQHFAQHESAAGGLPFDERSWRAPRAMRADELSQGTPNTAQQVRTTTDALQIDVFA